MCLRWCIEMVQLGVMSGFRHYMTLPFCWVVRGVDVIRSGWIGWTYPEVKPLAVHQNNQALTVCTASWDFVWGPVSQQTSDLDARWCGLTLSETVRCSMMEETWGYSIRTSFIFHCQKLSDVPRFPPWKTQSSQPAGGRLAPSRPSETWQLDLCLAAGMAWATA